MKSRNRKRSETGTCADLLEQFLSSIDQIQAEFVRHAPAPPTVPEQLPWPSSPDDTMRMRPIRPHGPARQGDAPRHRRGPRRRAAARMRWLRKVSLMLVAVALTLVAMLSVLSGLISYEPLRETATPGLSGTLAAWWPLLIYGPWLVASLSILRAALHRRSSTSSWAVLVVFSGLAVGLCVWQAPGSVTDVVIAGLPPVSALVAFHQIVRQIPRIQPPRHSRHSPHSSPAPHSPLSCQALAAAPAATAEQDGAGSRT